MRIPGSQGSGGQVFDPFAQAERTAAPVFASEAPAPTESPLPEGMVTFSGVDVKHADNIGYMQRDKYHVVYISKSPAMDKVHEILNHFPYCQLDRPYTADNLYHYSFELYY